MDASDQGSSLLSIPADLESEWASGDTSTSGQCLNTFSGSDVLSVTFSGYTVIQKCGEYFTSSLFFFF